MTYDGGRVRVLAGDCLDVLSTLPAASVDAVVTDPPYDLTSGKAGGSGEASLNLASPAGRSRVSTGRGFMGKGWDSTGVAFDPMTWVEVARVLKPGGHLLAFGGSRTWHRLAAAVEDAGFEVRDSIAWLYGSGFPKSLDVSKAIDAAAGAQREVVGEGARFGAGARGNRTRVEQGYRPGEVAPDGGVAAITAPATPEAARWAGWGTALKPAFEPIVVARKPLAGTVAANVLAHGTGALNIDGCRVAGQADRPGTTPPSDGTRGSMSGDLPRVDYEPSDLGRWPANVILAHAPDCGPDEAPGECAPSCPVADLDAQSGEPTSGANPTRRGADGARTAYGDFASQAEAFAPRGADSGGASRFFPTFRYEAKAPTAERPTANGVAHPTVKPLNLMRWLVRLVTPPDGLVLDPFAGSGTTGEACIAERVRAVLIEREEDYLPLIAQRLKRARPGGGRLTAAPRSKAAPPDDQESFLEAMGVIL